MAVNLCSGKQFAQDRTVPFVEAVLRKYAIAPVCIEIMVTGDGRSDKAVAALTRLKEARAGIS